MKSRLLLHILLVGTVSVLSSPITGLAASVESDVKDFLQGKDPKIITQSSETFDEVYSKHSPVIKESTLATVVFYFTEADAQTLEDIRILAQHAVTAAVAASRSDGDEDDLAGFITDAVCGAFAGGIHAAYKQVTSAGQAVEGGLKAAIDAGVKPDYAATAVTRGIDTCLQERLENDVILVLGSIVGTYVPGYSYIAPYQAYLPPTLGSGDTDLINKPETDFPGPDTDICVSNCI
jgi:hypothetical protein